MKHLSPILLFLILVLAACGGPGVSGDPDFLGGPLPEGSIVEINLGGTPYASGSPNVQIGMGTFDYPPDSLAIGVYVHNTPFGRCGLSMVIAGDIQPGTHTSGNMDGFVGGGMGCTELGDPIGTGLTGTLTLEQADGRFIRGSFDLTQAFEDGSTPITATGRFGVPYPSL